MRQQAANNLRYELYNFPPDPFCRPICHGSRINLDALSEHGGAKLHAREMVMCGEDGKDEHHNRRRVMI